MAVNLIYPPVLKTIAKHMIKGRTETRALLAWFLENYYRLDEMEVYEAVCDGHGDKGLDGILVNHQLRQIDVFQSQIVKGGKNEFGDAKVKQFFGSVAQLQTSAGAGAIIEVSNPELKSIAKRTECSPQLTKVTKSEASLSVTARQMPA